jgi:hypothetical protein
MALYHLGITIYIHMAFDTLPKLLASLAETWMSQLTVQIDKDELHVYTKTIMNTLINDRTSLRRHPTYTFWFLHVQVRRRGYQFVSSIAT